MGLLKKDGTLMTGYEIAKCLNDEPITVISSPKRQPVISSMVYLPFEWLDKTSGKTLLDRLTITPKAFGKEPRKPIETFVINHATRTIGLPYYFGVQFLRDRTLLPNEWFHLTDGFPIYPKKFPDPFFNTTLFPNQDKFFQDMIDAARKEGCFLAEAPTRSGKTLAALNMIGKLGRAALVIVPTKYLAKQWREEIKKHLGFAGKDIGIVEGGKCIWGGKSIIVAVIHNLVKEKWPKEFYRRFNTVIWDEGHKLGARMFAQSIKQFPAKVKCAMTATPHRKDGCQNIFLDYFGPPIVKSQALALACDCIVLNYQRKGKPLNSSIPLSILLNIISKSKSRNELIAFTAKTMYDAGRKGFLIVSDRIEQLQILAAMIVELGVPEDQVGLFTRTYIDENGKEKTFTQEDLDLVKDNKTIILASYGLIRDGVDIPRLDSGIDASPRAEGTQMIGRIRTPVEGKLKPVWFTIRDVGIWPLVRQCEARLKDYRQNNVRVIEGRQNTN